ncbi:hypothetical protein ACFV20_04360 [Streptomyces sp. NPDC059696]|uniref:hypothetical protein n=1 Tax=Streptomyces sp. NPDC059696 TaxID=3346911 RepID=UPI00367CA3DB
MLDSFLTPDEKRLLTSTAEGKEADFTQDGTKGKATIRAAVVREMALNETGQVREVGIRIKNAKVKGVLDLQGAIVRHRLHMTECDFDEGIEIRSCTIKSLTLSGSNIPELRANRLHSQGDMVLGDKFHSNGHVSLARARIDGDLDCRGSYLELGFDAPGVEVASDVLLGTIEDRRFTAMGSVDLTGAQISGNLKCSGGAFSQGFDAAAATISRSVWLDSSSNGMPFEANGPVRFTAAHIDGDFQCSGGRFRGRMASLQAALIKVRGSVILEIAARRYTRFMALGSVVFISGEIGADFNCRGALIGGGLWAERITIKGYARLGVRSSADGVARFESVSVVDLDKAQIGADLDCDGGAFGGRPIALRTDGAKISGRLRLSCEANRRFSAIGSVLLRRTEIGHDLLCSGAMFNGGFNASRMILNGDASFDVNADQGNHPVRCRAIGPSAFINASIGGVLDCRGAYFGSELDARRATVNGGVHLGLWVSTDRTIRFTASGLVQLMHMRVDGELDCEGGHFSEREVALCADGAVISRSAWLSPRNGYPFQAAGAVDFENCQIGNSFYCTGAFMGEETSLTAVKMRVSHVFEWNPGVKTSGALQLDGATVGLLQDAEARWPSKGKLHLLGFSYDGFSGSSPSGAKERCRWLAKQGSFYAQTYDQLARMYGRTGHDTEARKVLIRKETVRWLRGKMGIFGKFRSWLLALTVGYGYLPVLAAVWLTFFYLGGVALFSINDKGMLPTRPQLVGSSSQKPSPSHCTNKYPCFNPWAYALDVVVPLVDVHQAEYWQPKGNVKLSTAYQTYNTVGPLIGWGLTTLAVAGFTGIIRTGRNG